MIEMRSIKYPHEWQLTCKQCGWEAKSDMEHPYKELEHKHLRECIEYQDAGDIQVMTRQTPTVHGYSVVNVPQLQIADKASEMFNDLWLDDEIYDEAYLVYGTWQDFQETGNWGIGDHYPKSGLFAVANSPERAKSVLTFLEEKYKDYSGYTKDYKFHIQYTPQFKGEVK